jgi:hypothetical protein
MTVTEFLEQARECVSLADQMNGDHRRALLKMAEAWIKLADAEALKAHAKTDRQTDHT